MNGMKLFEALSGLEDDLLLTQERPVHPRRRLRRFLIAAAATVLLSITAAGLVLGSGRIELHEQDGQRTVSFHSQDIRPVEIGGWYPSELPDGYEVYLIGDNADNTQTIDLTNGEGGYLQLCFGEIRRMPDYPLPQDATLRHTQVGENDAVMSESIQERTVLRGGQAVTIQLHNDSLYWIDMELRLAYVLRYHGEPSLDLIPIAESIATTEALTPTYQDFAKAAVVKLGDYAPTWLPDGYHFASLHGEPVNPLMNPELRGHVHKIFHNTENYRIELFYEYLPDGAASIAVAEPASLTAVPIQIRNHDGMCYTTKDGIAYAVTWQWEDTTGIPLTFTLRVDTNSGGDGVTMEELLKIAESVEMLTPANTAAFDLSIYP